MTRGRSERLWAVVLIVLGVALLGFVSIAALRIVSDPGGYFDQWVASEEATGPEGSFSWASTDRRVEFTDRSTAGAADLEGRVWIFGDGAQSAKRNPSHRYGEDGEYTAALEVTDGNGLTSRSEATIMVQAGTQNAGQGELGLTELTATVERSVKGIGVVLLVIGLFLVLVMVGGRLLKQGVNAALRPIPERISVKVRPRELERELAVDFAPRAEDTVGTAPTTPKAEPAATDVAQHAD